MFTWSVFCIHNKRGGINFVNRRKISLNLNVTFTYYVYFCKGKLFCVSRTGHFALIGMLNINIHVVTIQEVYPRLTHSITASLYNTQQHSVRNKLTVCNVTFESRP